DPLRASLRPTPPGPFDRPLVQEGLEHGGLVLLPRGQHQRHRLATALGAEVDLGAEPAAAAAERFGRRVPPFAPAACWCARMTVPSTKCSSQSSSPAA